MQELKPKSILKSFRFRILILIFLLVSAVVLFILISKHATEHNSVNNSKFKFESSTDNTINIDYNVLKTKFDRDIDSILYKFSIKKEWIVTIHPGDKPFKSKSEKTRKEPLNAQWFVKNVAVPKEVISAEINLDISDYLNSAGIRFSVNEDIKTTDLSMVMFSPKDTTMSSLPYAVINIVHSEKIQRETGTYVIILNNIWEYKTDEINDLLNSVTEFSFVFPRNLEQIELQNKLIQMKKDVLINLTIGEKDKPEMDFSAGIDEKEIRRKVKSFAGDFPYVKTVILSRTDASIPKDKIFSQISEEFTKYDIRTIPDTIITKLSSKEDDQKNKVNSLINQMKEKITNKGLLIELVSLNIDELKSFYDEVFTLKKAGYKFYNVSQYFSKEEEKKKKEQQKHQKENTNDKEKTGKDKNAKP